MHVCPFFVPADSLFPPVRAVGKEALAHISFLRRQTWSCLMAFFTMTVPAIFWLKLSLRETWFHMCCLAQEAISVLCVLVCVIFFSMVSRAAEGTAGGVCQQALPGPGEDSEEPEERGADPGQNRGLEGGHGRGDRIFRCPCGIHPFMVSDLVCFLKMKHINGLTNVAQLSSAIQT